MRSEVVVGQQPPIVDKAVSLFESSYYSSVVLSSFSSIF